MLWDLFCRVIDNHGDVGVAWRLAADLATRGEQVRLWIDDPSALAWMAPKGQGGVQVLPWPTASLATALTTSAGSSAAELQGAPPPPSPKLGEVVIEAFGCELPDAVKLALAQQSPPPVWINLEYLSAEAYVERCHRLPSPQLAGVAAGLTKWFFYPGFTAQTGGLLREPDLALRQANFDAAAWLNGRGASRRPLEQVISLFCYDNPALPALINSLAGQPTLLLSCPGPVRPGLRNIALPDGVRHIELPWLSQRDHDHLLWSCDLNFVRGEDSLVRALWAGRPFIWNIYPQQDGAHAEKLQAFLQMFLQTSSPVLHQPEASDGAAHWQALSLAWNGLAPWPSPGTALWPVPTVWRSSSERRRNTLLLQADLCTQLLSFVREVG